MGGYPGADYFPEQQRERKHKKKRMVFNPGKKLPTLIAIFLLFYLVISFFTHFEKLYVLQRDIKEVDRQLQELSSKNDELKKQLKQAQSDAYIEQVAREKLGLVKPGESRIVPVQKEVQNNN